MGKLRVLVVEDSSTVRAHLCRVLSADPEIEIVGETGDGQDAIEKCVALRPDAISLDMILPTISGLAGMNTRSRARTIAATPDSIVGRSASSAARLNSGSSSRNSTPPCARVTSPGRIGSPPPISATSLQL